MEWSSERVLAACAAANDSDYVKVTLWRSRKNTSAWAEAVRRAWSAWDARYGIIPPFAYWECTSERPWTLPVGAEVILANEPINPTWRYRDVLRPQGDGLWELVFRTYPGRLLVHYDETPAGMEMNPAMFAAFSKDTGVSLSSPAPGLLSVLLLAEHDRQEVAIRLSGFIPITRILNVEERDSTLHFVNLGRIWGGPGVH